MNHYATVRMVMEDLLRVAFLTFLTFLVSVGGYANLPVHAAEVVDRIVAEVNAEIIPLSELERSMGPFVEKIKTMGYGAESEAQMIFRLREDLLKKLVDQRLTDQEALRLKLKVSDKEVDNAMERIKRDNGFTEERFRDVLAGEGLTLETYRDRVREQVLRGKLVNHEVKSKIVITRDDVREYYEKNRGSLSPDRKVNLSAIFLKIPTAAATAQQVDVRRRLEAIHLRLKAGEDFATLAREFSEAPGAREGGALGWFKLGALAPEVRQAVASLKAGEFTPVVASDAGVQIFRVVEAEQVADTPLETVYAEIEEKLFREIVDRKFDAWLEGLRSRSYIKIVR